MQLYIYKDSLFRATHVPVGQDQVQHIQFTREIARTFNKKFGQTFPIPDPLISGKLLR